MNTYIGFYVVKISAIFIMSVLYFICGVTVSILIDDAIPDKNLEDKSTIILIIQICTIVGMIGVIYYFLRVYIKSVTFFLDGLYGFKYSLLKEASGGIIFSYVLYTYQTKLHNLLIELKQRIMRTYNKLK